MPNENNPPSNPDLEQRKTELDAKLAQALREKSALRAVHLPPAAPSVDIALAIAAETTGAPDDIRRMLEEYFAVPTPAIERAASAPSRALPMPEALRHCRQSSVLPPWSECFPLSGRRGSLRNQSREIHSLFTGDLLWLFFMDRMGTFEMLGALLDDFAIRGKLALANDTIAAYLLELLTRDTVAGVATSARQREAVYARGLGWRSKRGAQLGVEATPNSAWNETFHRLVFHASQYFDDLRLGHAIRGAAQSATASVATFTTLRDTMLMLQNAGDPVSWGRVHANALSGIVGVLGTLALVRELRGQIGVPQSFTRIDQYVPAAWETLVNGRAAAPTGVNRYTAHRECATYGRNLLLQLEVLDLQNRVDVELWLSLVEDQFEGYRTAYRTLTGVDLGAANAAVEQAM